MSPKAQSSEKHSLLPVVAPPPASEPDQNAPHKFESALFYMCIATLAVLFGSLYCKDLLPAANPLATTLQLLHAGMLSSLWASLPAPALLFVCAPYFAERAKVTMVRYWIYLLYIVGVVVGALVFGSEANAMKCEMAMR